MMANLLNTKSLCVCAEMVFATLDMTILAGLAFDTNGRFVGLYPIRPSSYLLCCSA